MDLDSSALSQCDNFDRLQIPAGVLFKAGLLQPSSLLSQRPFPGGREAKRKRRRKGQCFGSPSSSANSVTAGYPNGRCPVSSPVARPGEGRQRGLGVEFSGVIKSDWASGVISCSPRPSDRLQKIVPPLLGDISCASAPTPYQAPQRPNRPLAHWGYHKCTLQHTCCMSPPIRLSKRQQFHHGFPTRRFWQIGLLNSSTAKRNLGHYSYRRTRVELLPCTYTFLEGALKGEAPLPEPHK